MALSSIFRALRGAPAEEKHSFPVDADLEGEKGEKGQATDDAAAVDSTDDLRPTEGLQRGVQQVEAVTLSWSKATLIAVFIKYVVACLVDSQLRQRLTSGARFQYLGALPRQCLPKCHSQQPAPLRHQ